MHFTEVDLKQKFFASVSFKAGIGEHKVSLLVLFL